MTDIKIISIKDLLPVSDVTFASKAPLSVRVSGERFQEATTVLINDLPAPEFMILSDRQLIAQVPSSEAGNLISKIAVLAETPSASRKSSISFEVGTTFKGLQGIERMVQAFAKLLLQTPGSDRFRPNLGGGLLSLVGKNFSQDGAKLLQATAVSAVDRTREQLVTLQSKNQKIPNDERLLTAVTEGVGFDPILTALSLRVNLAAVSGKQAVANLTF